MSSAAAAESFVPVLPPGPARFSAIALATWVLRPLSLLDKLTKQYGNSFTLPDFAKRAPMLWTGEPEAIRDIFGGDPDALHAGEANFIVEGVLGAHSLLLLDGEAHRRERKLMMPPFHGERMRAYSHEMRRVAAAAIDRWAIGSTFSMLEEMQAVTLDIIVRTVFGVDEGGAGEGKGELRGMLRELLGRVADPLVFAASIFFGSAQVRDWAAAHSGPIKLPGGLSLDVSAFVPGGRMSRLMQEVDKLLHAEFATRRARADLATRTDVLSLLLQAKDDRGNPMSDAELRDEMMTLLVAGHETTATSLAWAIHHLLGNPDTMAALRDELLPGGRPIESPEAIAGLEYLDAVIKETMRLTPVLPLVARMTKRDLPIGPYRVPAGTMVMPSVYLVHHRADLYPEPERFRPERFTRAAPRTYGPHEFLPFGGGVRRCLGATFATHEMKMVLAEIVSRVHLAPAGPVKLERRAILFAPSGGTRVKRVA